MNCCKRLFLWLDAIHSSSFVSFAFNLVVLFHCNAALLLNLVLGFNFIPKLLLFRRFFVPVALLKNAMIALRLPHLLGSCWRTNATCVDFNFVL
jgi:hypothetical protein